MEINKSTSKFNNSDLKKLKIKFDFIENFNIDGVDIPESLLLNNYTKKEIKESNGELDQIGNSLCEYIKDVLDNEMLATGTDESNTGNFVSILLRFINFDIYPFKIKHKPKYFFHVNSIKDEESDNPRVVSIPDLSIIKGKNVLMVDEDKHYQNINQLTMGKPQIAGEMIAIAYTNKLNNLINKRKYTEEFTVYATRVIGTKFTFYKSIINSDYLNEIAEGEISNGLTIYEFTNTEYEMIDFCNPEERKNILSILFKLKNIFSV